MSVASGDATIKEQIAFKNGMYCKPTRVVMLQFNMCNCFYIFLFDMTSNATKPNSVT